ncbi:MAG: hypothetical protein DWH81_09140 [Planctomycetota bacterium]|nr:MAG: hypothetical protein DWH81_09140 [Planctomycetota bacterium]
MAAKRVRWLVGWSAACLVSWGFWIALSSAQAPVLRPTASQGSSSTLTPAVPTSEQMKPLTPLEAAPLVNSDSVDVSNGCVVLNDGRVFQGNIVQLSEAYQVNSNAGTVTFPFAQVRTVGASLSLAYSQLRESYEHPTVNDHLSLGQWCAQNKLYEEASLEAQAALVLEPTRKEALSLLKKSEDALGRETPAAVAEEAARLRPNPAGAVVSSEAQLQFTRQVNRIALNKCGNGTCHGPASFSPFKLTRSSKSDPNLQAILKYIDTSDPEMSPLLVNARSVEGPHDGLFQGAKGREQYATIQAWVVQVAREQNNMAGARKRPAKPLRESGPVYTIRPTKKVAEDQADVASDSGVSTADSSGMELENAPEVDISGETPEIKTVAAEDEPATSPAARPKRTAPLNSETIQKLLKSQDPDAFDPDEFNRMIHGDRPAPVE